MAISQSINTQSASNNIINFSDFTSNQNPIKKRTYVRYKGNGTVQPIKKKSDIERAKQYFHDTSSRYTNLNIRNYCLFVMGINIGRRISDILNFHIGELVNPDGTINNSIKITEGKTKKKATILLHPNVIDAIKEYLDSLGEYSLDDYLFASRSTNTKHHRSNESKAITRNMAWKIMHDMGEELGIDHMGTHSLRKTKGTQYLLDNKNDYHAVVTVSKAYNHSKPEITYDYLGIDDPEMVDFYP
jgi:integrase